MGGKTKGVVYPPVGQKLISPPQLFQQEQYAICAEIEFEYVHTDSNIKFAIPLNSKSSFAHCYESIWAKHFHSWLASLWLFDAQRRSFSLIHP